MREIDELWSLSAVGGAIGAFAALMLAAPAAHADSETSPPGVEQPLATQAAEGDATALAPAPPAEVQHLSSPQNLPPGTTDVPLEAGPGRTASYLRDLWHAVQTQEISGKGALLLLTQRPLDPNAMPTNGLPAGPQAPPGTPFPQGPAPDAAAPESPPTP
ncbi:hypothetical protein A5662_02120 [Mycobacteriaceae bacterium 1482268.1]|nr:hypothetical protein A5662_02120 [Mycobacteriaceae bacterium 1482268.1]